MTRARIFSTAVLTFVLASGVALASWYDDYDAGLGAVRKGQWSTVVQKMTAAISGNGKESDKARTYGAIFINYHPYYYRAVAYLNLGKYDQAVADLERTSGPGPENLGSIELLMQNAKLKQEQANNAAAPAPEPAQPAPSRPTPTVVTQPPVTPAPVPAAPSMDPALRQRANASINTAKDKLAAAQRRKAQSSPQYAQALTMITDANTKNASAKSNDELNAVIAIAENAGLIADSATPPGAPPVPAPQLNPVIPRPLAAADAVLADTKRQLRQALENYFAGEFESASRSFEDLSRKLPNNAWIFAFLGASQYSQYAFEADPSYKAAATESFRRAKQLGKWRNGLPEKYFSKRIRKAFNETT